MVYMIEKYSLEVQFSVCRLDHSAKQSHPMKKNIQWRPLGGQLETTLAISLPSTSPEGNFLSFSFSFSFFYCFFLKKKEKLLLEYFFLFWWSDGVCGWIIYVIGPQERRTWDLKCSTVVYVTLIFTTARTNGAPPVTLLCQGTIF